MRDAEAYWVRFEDMGPPIELPNGGHLPEWCHLTYGDPLLCVELALRLDDGRMAVAGMRSVGAPLSFTALTRIRWSTVSKRITEQAAAMATRERRRSAGEVPGEPTDRWLTLEEEHAARERATAMLRRRVTDELLRDVARTVIDNPQAPNRAVQEKHFTGSRNATRWIAEARRRGYLDEVKP